MKYIFFSFLALIGGCMYCPKSQELDTAAQNSYESDEVLQVKINHRKSEFPFLYARDIEIYKEGEIYIDINQSLLLTNITYFYSQKPVRSISYNIWGEQVAECIIKDNKPFSGTTWCVVTGLKGLKYSSIITYKDGNYISEKPYEEEKISKLLKGLGELYNSWRPVQKLSSENDGDVTDDKK